MSDQKIIEGCSLHRRKAQQALYDRYSRLLFGVCLRYSGGKTEAEDILQEVFIKIFSAIGDFTGNGSFEGWMKKIAVNTAITHYHKNLKFRGHVDVEDLITCETEEASFEENYFSTEELLLALAALSDGYRLIFNLYAVEGYKHREIAEMLNIDTGTSKSQYSRAKSLLREKLNKLRSLRGNYPSDTD